MYEKKASEKSEKVAKNELQRLKNIARAKKVNIPRVGLPVTSDKANATQVNLYIVLLFFEILYVNYLLTKYSVFYHLMLEKKYSKLLTIIFSDYYLINPDVFLKRFWNLFIFFYY